MPGVNAIAFDQEVLVRRTRYASEESGWAVVDALDEEGEPVVLVGPLVHLEERERAHVIGMWVDDSRYGLQVKVSEAHPVAPTDDATVIAYLRRVKHVGAKRAQTLIDRHGAAAVFDVIDADPEQAFVGAGLRRARAEEAAQSWQELRVTRRLHLLLAPHGLAYLVKRIHSEYGPTAHRHVVEHPYELTRVFGVGFLVADRIARSLGTDAAVDPRARALAGALHLLGEAERSGSTCLPQDALRANLAELLATPVAPGLIDAFVASGALVREDGWLYRPATAALEAELAARVDGLVRAEPPDDDDRLGPPDDEDVRRVAGDQELTPEQHHGVTSAFAHRLSLITGGPGTGKTASIRTIAGLAAAAGAKVMLLAPTGRAAIRMTEASGVRARTVHSALGWIPGEGPTHDEEDPLVTDLLIVDETSMANLELLVTLLRAVAPATHVVLVGDADQLAPVGAGKPFAELVASGLVPTTR